ncbi:MAG TPA: molecular chaperone TorD family protein [Nitrososphaerales archaeon]|nr:molecular chaperone TorD family protein [Nitrososphaerales archaeon]
MDEPGDAERTKARMALYADLSTAFKRPASDLASLWVELRRAVTGDSDSESPPLQDARDLVFEYDRPFVGPARLPCPPHEPVHSKDRPEMDQGTVAGPSVLDAKRLCAEAGLAVSKEFHDLPDHIAAELEFMAYLCEREQSETTAEGREMWRRRQGELFELHLGPWAAGFEDKVTASTGSPFYQPVASLLRAFVVDEAKDLAAVRGSSQ